MKVADIEEIFTYHPPSKGPEKYIAIREKAKELALLVNELAPESREKSISLTHIQTAVMFANAAVAIHEKEKVCL